MKHLEDFALYLLRTLLLIFITLVISLSLLQQRFPPSFASFFQQIKTLQSIYAANQNSLNSPADLSKLSQLLSQALQSGPEIANLKNKVQTYETKLNALETDIQLLKAEINHLKTKK